MSDYMDAYREQQELDEEVRIASEQDEIATDPNYPEDGRDYDDSEIWGEV